MHIAQEEGNKQTPTHKRESVCLCMLSELSVGSNGSFGLSRPEETQTGWPQTPSQPTYIRKRGCEWRLTLREIQMETADIFKNQCLEKKAEEKVKERESQSKDKIKNQKWN